MEQPAVKRPTTPPLPAGTKPLSHQIAGHKYGQGKTKLGFLQSDDGTLLKPVQCPPRGERELKFYQLVFDPECKDPVLLKLRSFMATYLGTWTCPVNPGVLYFRLEDVTRKFRKPCIADIKIGPRTWDPEATPEKIQTEKVKYPPVQKIGFQILGLRVHHPRSGQYVYYDKDHCRNLTEHDILNEGIGKYLNNDEHLRKDVAKVIVKKLREIEEWFESQRELSFYASSILLVYEADEDSGKAIPQCNGLIKSIHSAREYSVSSVCSHTDRCKLTDPQVEVRLIDFAHVFPTTERDDNYLTGLRSLINYMKILSQ